MLNVEAITVRQAKKCLKTMYDIKSPLILWGEPGVGKSAIVAQFCKENNLFLIDNRASQMSAEDARGFYIPDHTNKQAICYPPSFLPRSGKGVLFLDELNRASVEVQNALLELVLDRRLGDSYELPDGWVVFAASNWDDGVSTNRLSEALADRFTHLNVICSASEWIQDFAIPNGIHPAIITFIQRFPQLINSDNIKGDKKSSSDENTVRPSPRSYAVCSDILMKEDDIPIAELLIRGRLGNVVTAELTKILVESRILPDIGKLFSLANGKASQLKTILEEITSIIALYTLVYGVVGYCSSIESYRLATIIFTTLNKIKDSTKTSRREVTQLGMNILLERMVQQHPSYADEFYESDEYAEFEGS